MFWEAYTIPPTAYLFSASLVPSPAFTALSTPVIDSGVTINSPATLSSSGIWEINASSKIASSCCSGVRVGSVFVSSGFTISSSDSNRLSIVVSSVVEAPPPAGFPAPLCMMYHTPVPIIATIRQTNNKRVRTASIWFLRLLFLRNSLFSFASLSCISF